MLNIGDLILYTYVRPDVYLTVLTFDTTSVIWSGFYDTAPAWVKKIPTIQMHVNHLCESGLYSGAADDMTLIASKRYEKAPD